MSLVQASSSTGSFNVYFWSQHQILEWLYDLRAWFRNLRWWYSMRKQQEVFKDFLFHNLLHFRIYQSLTTKRLMQRHFVMWKLCDVWLTCKKIFVSTGGFQNSVKEHSKRSLDLSSRTLILLGTRDFRTGGVSCCSVQSKVGICKKRKLLKFKAMSIFFVSHMLVDDRVRLPAELLCTRPQQEISFSLPRGPVRISTLLYRLVSFGCSEAEVGLMNSLLVF